MNRERKLIHVR